MTQILITGASGYIGGDYLYAFLDAHPELQGNITALSRSSDSAAKIARVYPKIKYAYGSLDDSEAIRKAAAEADIVLHFADCDHVGAARAIVAGLTEAGRTRPAYLIHTCGTGMLTYEDLKDKRYGEPPTTTPYNDWDAVSTVTSVPSEAWHRPVDEIVLAASVEKGVRTAIVSPPTIYGPGRGPGNQRSIQWVKMAACGLKRGKGFMVGRGLNEWTYVHVQDLVRVYVSITEAALSGSDDPEIFGAEGYFFAEAGSYVWGELARKIAKESHKQGFIDTDEIDSLSAEEADKLIEGGSAQWGMNSRVEAIRANKVFGWKPQKPVPDEILGDLVKTEAEAAGLVKHHAQVAAGE